VTEPGVIGSLPPAALRPKDAARYLGLGVTFLGSLPIRPIRVRGTGKTGKAVILYLVRDLDAWLEGQAARRDPDIHQQAS
jgi:hypothetical protein